MKLPLKLFAFVVFFTAVTAAPATAAPAHYRVVGTGDSILFLVAMSGQLQSADRWIDTEAGRQAYVKGLDNRYSTAQMLPILLAKSQPGGWVVVQDDTAGTSAEWQKVIHNYVEKIPNDRCILAVLPVVARTGVWDLISPEQSVVNARITRIEVNRQPCHAYVRWDLAVNNHPEYVTADGKHPTDLGMAWLAAAIDNAVGFRV